MPERFLDVSFRWRKLFSLTFAVTSTGFIVGPMFVWPWIDKLFANSCLGSIRRSGKTPQLAVLQCHEHATGAVDCRAPFDGVGR